MQKVEAGLYQEVAPAARYEDMTQPMGPLEKGDQAIVDAVNAIPDGQHQISHEDGSKTWLNKHEGFSDSAASVSTNGPSGDKIQAVANVRNIGYGKGEVGDIHASEIFPHESLPGNTSIDVTDNIIKKGMHKGVEDREQAQAFKLDVAERLSKANKHLGEKALEGANK